MSWLDTLLSEDPKKICPLCPFSSGPLPSLNLKGDKASVPDLSPTCPPLPDFPCRDPTLEGLCEMADSPEAQYLRQERAGILEFQGGFTRQEAERRALVCH